MLSRIQVAILIAGATLSAGAFASAQGAGAAGPTKEPAAVRSGNYVLDPAHSKISWSVSHLGYSTYLGQFTGVAGTLRLDARRPEASTLAVEVDTNSVGTLHTGLDTHLKSADFLHAAKFPQARFRSTGLRLTGKRTADVSGQLTLHGVTRTIVFKAVFNQAGVNPIDKKYTVGFDGTARIRRSDFGITTFAPAISEEVELQLAAEFKPAA